MVTKPKIKIIDNSNLRLEIDKLYELTKQIDLSKWAIKCAKHILPYLEAENIDMKIIENGFNIIELWQNGEVNVHEVRQAGFKIHEVARHCKSEITKNVIRTVGQAVGVGHMREHAMVCSDYAIKSVQIAFPDNFDKITKERQWQLNELRKYVKNKTSP